MPKNPAAGLSASCSYMLTVNSNANIGKWGKLYMAVVFMSAVALTTLPTDVETWGWMFLELNVPGPQCCIWCVMLRCVWNP